MCGIAGMIGPGADPATVRAMCAAMVHRGPDDDGFWDEPGAVLGMRRLAIIDLSTGHQPIGSEDGSVQVILNGEIYNYRELRADLEARGHQFRTHSDTESVVHAYEEYGDACPTHLRGMFAVAIWDRRRRRLLLARDRLGKKPLLYAVRDGILHFASEFAALLRAPRLPRSVHLPALQLYLTFGYIPAPLTAYEGLLKLPPAHALSWQDGSARIWRYWGVDFGTKRDVGEAEAAEQLRAALQDAVRARMIADVPLGAFLSGGIDSSAVVATMAQLSPHPVRTFSVGFSERDYDELRYARLVAQRFGTDHHEEIVDPSSADILPLLVTHYGEPYADSSAVPTYHISRVARRHVTVVLNGDGGDEMFAGYERYLAMRIATHYRRLPAALRHSVVEPLLSALPEARQRGVVQRLRRFFAAASLPPARRYLRWVAALGEEMQRELYTPGFAALSSHVDPWNGVGALLRKDDGVAGLDALLQVDLLTYLPEDLLVKVDVASMANSLEARSPFLDHQLVEFAAALPAQLKLRGMTSKYLLKRAFRDVLPRPILRRRKMGFGVPVGAWLRGPWRDLLREAMLSERCLRRGYFRPTVVARLVGEHLDGQRDWARPLWTLLMLELWHRAFIDQVQPAWV